MLTAGTIAAIILIPLGTLFLIAAAILAYVALLGDVYDSLGWGAGSGFAAAIGLPMVIFPLIGLMLVGFNGDYLTYHPVNGKVSAVASRMISDGKAMSTRYVFQINGQAYGVDDTRAALVKPGDTVNLNCTKEFVWGSTSNGWACNWG